MFELTSTTHFYRVRSLLAAGQHYVGEFYREHACQHPASKPCGVLL